MADLPSDLLTEIISRLPPQPILRFRLSSKWLKSIIDSHNFTNLHLKNSLNFNLILSHDSEFYQFDFPNLTTTGSLYHPLTSKSDVALLGSCNGLLCISNQVDEIAFWNPNIRKHHFIPYPPSPHRSIGATFHFVVHGFAYDPFSEDYKLLRISSSIDIICELLPNMAHAIASSQDMAVFVENSFHWVTIHELDNFHQPALIVAFNLAQEIFNEVPLPEILASTSQDFGTNLSLLGQSLCMLLRYQNMNNKTTKVDVWVMKEYGFRDSWCVLFTLEEVFFSRPFTPWKPLGYSGDRSKVLLEVDCEEPWGNGDIKIECKKLFWYDLKSKRATCVPGIPNINKVMIYVGSLLPPSLPIDDNYNYMKENQPRLKCESKMQVKLNRPSCPEIDIEKKLRKNKTGCLSCLW
ncbi:F-box protein interaction domain protein [Medicago truncatula]|uniref:F-box protein interaction domain protein n=2 Tax=Medicago truncatula TaxID=3880 RepID=G7JVN4_MEDTR|nr:F-box protein interaction domain protein [Medicago truncatula]